MATFTKADFKRLQWNIVLLVVLLASGGGAIFYAAQQQEAATRTHRQAEAGRNDIRARLSRAQDEEKELREKIARYQQLNDRGIVGQEHRLDWVERIRAIKQERNLIDLQYELAPQAPLDPAVVPNTGAGVELMSSPMKLQMQLLHEGDLLGFIGDLNRNVQAFIRVKQCDITRIPITPRERGAPPQLRADCELDWITLRDKR
jgi:hypothetical protein